MTNLNNSFPTNSNAPSADYPYGSARNITTSGDDTGTPFVASLYNDILGLQQYLIKEAGIVPNGSPDDATTNQQFDAIWKILNDRTVTHNFTTDADYTLTASQNLKKRYVITDTSPVLTATRNVIVDKVQKRFLVQNNTLQTLTFKTIDGTGIDVDSGSSADLYCDGTIIISAGINSFDTTGLLSTDNLLHIQDQKPSGTNGGSSSAGDNTRDLNTILVNNISGSSLLANQFTLSSGTYWVEGLSVGRRSDRHRNFIYNVSDSATELIGINSEAENAQSSSTTAMVSGLITIASSKTFELRHRIFTAVSTSGLGLALTTGDVEVYSDVKVWKVG